MHIVQKGDLAKIMIIGRLLHHGLAVLQPISELSRYDLVIDNDGKFERVQCKTGRLKDGAVKFRACSLLAHHKNKIVKLFSYRGQIDWFGIYCPDNDKCYLIHVNEVGERQGSLRVSQAKNGQAKCIKLASKYEI